MAPKWNVKSASALGVPDCRSRINGSKVECKEERCTMLNILLLGINGSKVECKVITNTEGTEMEVTY